MIIDENGNEIKNPDLSLGKLVPDEMVVHVPAVEGSPAVFREEVIWQGNDPDDKLVKKVLEVPAVASRPAYEKVVRVQKYVLYTKEELAEIEKQRQQEEQERLEAEREAAKEAAKRAEQEAWLADAPDALLEVAALSAANEERVTNCEDALIEIASIIEGE